jgi:HD superfamily phosphohydrolase
MIIKDEVFGTIEFDKTEAKIIDHPIFQRLRRIKQMSVSYLVYPGANHSRFEHSLGTSHLSALIAKKVGLDQEKIEKVKMYGLVHDLGHCAFSHEGEHILSKYLGNHEEVGKKMIKESEIGDIINEKFSKKEIIDLGKNRLGEIVTSDIGSDRMDYLKRDALNTGVAYGIIDIDRIINTLKFKNEIYVSKKGIDAAEYLLIARATMFATVYLHKTVRAATVMLFRAISKSVEDGTMEPKEFLEIGDEIALEKMKNSKEGSVYAKGLLERKLVKEIVSINGKFLTPNEAEEVEQRINEKFKLKLLLDSKHHIFKEPKIKVETNEGLESLMEFSKIVKALKESETQKIKTIVFGDENTRRKINTKELEKFLEKIS